MAGAASGFDAGCVRIQLACRNGRVAAATVISDRPDVTSVLRGKSAAAAVALVPLVFAVCGRAQGRAATLALAAARGLETPPQLDPAIEAEVLREHLWRLLLDLPPLLGLEPQRDMFAEAFRAVGAGARDALTETLNQPFWNRLMAALVEQDEADAAPQEVGALLPVMSARQSLTAWPRLGIEQSRTPLWQGLAAETGAYARCNGQNPSPLGSFAARWQARWAEVWSWAAGATKVGAGGTASAAAVAPGIGRALVETARGLLMHELQLGGTNGELVADYRIIAPTEWNFHPQGMLSVWLPGRATENDGLLKAFVARAVAALDPCVRWELERR